MKVAHGHVQDLIKKGVDYVLLPNVVNVEAPESVHGLAPLPVEPDAAVRDSRRCPNSRPIATSFSLPPSTSAADVNTWKRLSPSSPRSD